MTAIFAMTGVYTGLRGLNGIASAFTKPRNDGGFRNDGGCGILHGILTEILRRFKKAAVSSCCSLFKALKKIKKW